MQELEVEGRLVVCGVYDYIVKLWDPGREECLNDVANKVRKLGGRAKPKVVHLNRLVPYRGMVDVGDRHPKGGVGIVEHEFIFLCI